MRAFLSGIIAALAIAVGAAFFFPGLARAAPVYVEDCSGTYIGGGYVITAMHCVRFKTETTIKVDKEAEGGWTARVVWTNDYHDIAMLKFAKELVKKDGQWIPGEDYKSLPFTATKVGCTYPKLHDTYKMKGWPAGMYTEVDAIIVGDKARRGHWPVTYFIASAGYSGSSGSGLYKDSSTTIYGVVVGMIPGSGLMVAVPTAEVCSIIPRDAE